MLSDAVVAPSSYRERPQLSIGPPGWGASAGGENSSASPHQFTGGPTTAH